MLINLMESHTIYCVDDLPLHRDDSGLAFTMSCDTVARHTGMAARYQYEVVVFESPCYHGLG
jgi:hypothetical protein